MNETEKLEAQVAEWIGVANQQILRIQELEGKLEADQKWIKAYHQKWRAAEKERDSTLALARQAVEVLRTITDPTPITGGRCVLGNDQSRDEHAAQFYRGYNAGILAQWERFTKPATAFLARSDVVKLGGGK